MKRLDWLIVCVAVIAGLSGCLQRGEFPDEPYLEYLSFERQEGLTEMRFRFTDGDGNVGLDNRDTMPPFNATNNPINLNHWNLWWKYYFKQDGEWIVLSAENDPPLYLDPNASFFRIPRLDPQGQNKALEGEIVVDMTNWFPLTNHDTVKYGFILLDRDLNRSNEAQSPELYPNQ